MTRHTPGPWHADYHRHGDVYIVTGKDHSDIAHGTNINGSRSLAEQLANMRLIAAAPELLAALHRLLDDPQADDVACARRVLAEVEGSK